MKIKYQSGGVVAYTPFIPNSVTSPQPSATPETKQEKITGTLQKEIVDVLKESGIQNDVDTFLSQANAFLTKSKSLSGVSLFGGENTDYSMSDLVSVLSMANRVKQNKLQHTEATKRLDNQDAWNEVAVTTTGQVYVYEKDKGLKTVSAEDYYENKDSYQALTNSQVLGLREQDPNLAFNGTFKSDILKDVSSAIGMKSVETELLNIVDKFGSVTRSEYIQNTGEPISKSVYDGMQLLIGKGPEGYYKVTTTSERENIDSALKYLWSAIGTDGQAKLRAEAAINGNDPNKNHYDLILQVLQHHTDYSQTPEFDKTATEYEAEKGKKGNEVLTPESRTEMIARGYGKPEKIEIVPRVETPSGTQTAITATAINFGQLLDKQGDMLDGLMSLREVLQQDPAFRAQTDAKNITFGNIHLKRNDLDKIVVDTNWNNLSGVYLPYKEDGAGVVPDFSMVDAYNYVEQKLKDNPNMIAAEVQKLLKSKGIDPSKVERVEMNGQYVYKLKTQYFLTFSAYGNRDTIKAIKDNTRYFEHIGEEDGVWMRKDALSQFNPDVFNEVTKYGKLDHGKKSAPVVEGRFWKGDDWDPKDAYMGNIFVAVDPMRATIATEHKLTDRSVFENPAERYQIVQNAQNPRMKANFDE